MLDDGTIVILVGVLGILGIGGYTIKRSFDENQSCIAAGMHQKALEGTDKTIWVKE